MGYAVYHTEKGTSGPVAIGQHIDRVKGREKSYRNADPALRHLNADLAKNRFSEMPLPEAVKARISEGYTGKKAIRRDAVRFLKHVLTGSHEEMMELAKDPEKLKDWARENYKFIAKEFGKGNIVRFTLHMDEKTPHIHAVTIPLTEDGRLSAKQVIGNPKAMSERQDRYAAGMERFGLERGIKGTGIEHETAKQYYGRVTALDKEIIQKANQVSDIIDQAKINPLRINAAKSDLKAQISTFVKNNGIIQGKEILRQNEAFRRQNKEVKGAEAYARLIAVSHEIKKEVSILDFFSSLVNVGKLRFDGKRGNEYYFAKGDQKTGSIAVNPQKGVWYDHAGQMGGDIFSAAGNIGGLQFTDAVRYISSQQGFLTGASQKLMKSTSVESVGGPVEVTAVFDRVIHPALRDYVAGRGLNASTDLAGIGKEVHWNKGDKQFFAVGFKSDQGGYVLRSKLFKGNIGKIGVVGLRVGIPKEDRITEFKVFEGFFDFLSYRRLHKLDKFFAIILNGLANLKNVIPRLREHVDSGSKITAYLDNDDAGKKATTKLLQEIPQVRDGSNEYENFKDLNEELVKNGEEKQRKLRI